MLKNTKIVTMSAHGDAFGSRHSRYLIKRIHEVYPDIKFDLFTNGILLNQQNIADLGIEKNIHAVKVSLHAARKDTYVKMVRNGHLYFDTVRNNLKYVSELKKLYNFDFYLFFVVTSFNYQDFPTFSEYRDEQLQSFCKHPDFVITNPKHKNYKKLIKILNDPVFEKNSFGMSPALKEIRAKKFLLPKWQR